MPQIYFGTLARAGRSANSGTVATQPSRPITSSCRMGSSFSAWSYRRWRPRRRVFPIALPTSVAGNGVSCEDLIGATSTAVRTSHKCHYVVVRMPDTSRLSPAINRDRIARRVLGSGGVPTATDDIHARPVFRYYRRVRRHGQKREAFSTTTSIRRRLRHAQLRLSPRRQSRSARKADSETVARGPGDGARYVNGAVTHVAPSATATAGEPDAGRGAARQRELDAGVSAAVDVAVTVRDALQATRIIFQRAFHGDEDTARRADRGSRGRMLGPRRGRQET